MNEHLRNSDDLTIMNIVLRYVDEHPLFDISFISITEEHFNVQGYLSCKQRDSLISLIEKNNMIKCDCL